MANETKGAGNPATPAELRALDQLARVRRNVTRLYGAWLTAHDEARASLVPGPDLHMIALGVYEGLTLGTRHVERATEDAARDCRALATTLNSEHFAHLRQNADDLYAEFLTAWTGANGRSITRSAIRRTWHRARHAFTECAHCLGLLEIDLHDALTGRGEGASR